MQDFKIRLNVIHIVFKFSNKQFFWYLCDRISRRIGNFGGKLCAMQISHFGRTHNSLGDMGVLDFIAHKTFKCSI